jgi:hypothetical protein
VLRTTEITAASVILGFLTGGCVDGFQGANIQIDLRNASMTSSEFPVQARYGAMPDAGELPANVHLTLYAVPDPMNPAADLIEIKKFEVHRLVDPGSPCFIDAGEHVPHPGLHVTSFAAKISEDTGITDVANPPDGATERQKIEMATALQRIFNVEQIAGLRPDVDGNTTGIRVVTSASSASYPGVAPDCTEAAGLIPPPPCIDEASNQRRLALCRAAWDADPSLFEGTDRVLTAPLNGITHGFVDGVNPLNEAPVGGAQFFIPENALSAFRSYAMYYQTDGSDGPGTRLLSTVAVASPTRGLTRFTLVGPSPAPMTPPFVALMAVFSDLGNDDVLF